MRQGGEEQREQQRRQLWQLWSPRQQLRVIVIIIGSMWQHLEKSGGISEASGGIWKRLRGIR